MSQPKVSVCCLSYNHEKYIRQCLDSIVMQQTIFPIEVLVHDDASTDSSQQIILEYAKKYPDIVKPILQTENQYVKGKGILGPYLLPHCKGEYVAICECDDYWTDPLKLQKQIDILEAHHEYIFCCHRYTIYNEADNSFAKDYASEFFKDNQDIVVTQELQSRTWLTKVLTMVMHTDMFKQASLEAERKYGNGGLDTYIFYELLKLGNGIALNQFMGMYRQQNNGIWSQLDQTQKAKSNYLVFQTLYEQNKDDKYVQHALQQNAIHYLRLLSCWNSKNRKVFQHIYGYMDSAKLKINAILSFILPFGLIQATKKLFHKC